MKIGIIGYGYWGKIWANNVRKSDGIELVGVYDTDSNKREKAREQRVEFVDSVGELLNRVQAVIVATPETTHASVTKTCLLAGKHVLVEKPASTVYREAAELVKIAEGSNLVLMVDNTFRYDRSYLELKELVKTGVIGSLKKIVSYRFSLNINKPQIGVITDLMPHDLSLFIDLVGGVPVTWSVKLDCLYNSHGDSADIEMDFGKVKMRSYLSWIYPFARREMYFLGEKGTLSWLKKDGDADILKHHAYDRNHNLELVKEWEVTGKSNTLMTVLDHFTDCVQGKKQPETSVEKALPEIRMLEKMTGD